MYQKIVLTIDRKLLRNPRHRKPLKSFRFEKSMAEKSRTELRRDLLCVIRLKKSNQQDRMTQFLKM